MLATLTYSVSHEVLTYKHGEKVVLIPAVSGLGRGWTLPTDEPHFPAGGAAMRYVNRKNWGPIPPGFYRVRRPVKDPKHGYSARLESHLGPKPYGRDGFLIHETASHKNHGRFHNHASEGCIVPRRIDDLYKLLNMLHEVAPGKEYVATLHVTE